MFTLVNILHSVCVWGGGGMQTDVLVLFLSIIPK